MAKIVITTKKKDANRLDLCERAVLHYMLLNRTKEGFFCQKPSFMADELNSTSQSICRYVKALVAKGAVTVVEANRHNDTGFHLPTIYLPIPPVEWAMPIPPVEQAPIPLVEQAPIPLVEQALGPIPPVVLAKSLKTAPVPNGTITANIVSEQHVSVSDKKETIVVGMCKDDNLEWVKSPTSEFRRCSGCSTKKVCWNEAVEGKSQCLVCLERSTGTPQPDGALEKRRDVCQECQKNQIDFPRYGLCEDCLDGKSEEWVEAHNPVELTPAEMQSLHARMVRFETRIGEQHV